MSFSVRLPNISASTAEGQVQQMKGYLYQLAQELEFAFHALENNSAEMAAAPKSEDPAGREKKAIENFHDIKGLIIKSADIVDAYYEKMSENLRGDYVAVSDFGTFREQTSQQIEKTSQSITQMFENNQQITVRMDALDGAIDKVDQVVDAMSGMVKSVTAVIRTGLLYTDEYPVYGMEIGQQVDENGVEVFRKFCRLVSDRLSFFDSYGNEVAYLSGNRMYVTGIEAASVKSTVTSAERIQMGNYIWALGSDGHLSLS